MGRFIDLTGKTFGRWIVLKQAPTRRNFDGTRTTIYWKCRCSCTNKTVAEVESKHLRIGKSTSCGCYHLEQVTRHGCSQHPLYVHHYGMWRRCTDPDDQDYTHYGGRNIGVCEEWKDIRNFIRDMFPTFFLGATIERLDVNKGYEKSNCTWVSNSKQSVNRTITRWVDFKGERLCFNEAARRSGIGVKTARSRLRLGWPVESIFNTPVKTYNYET